MIITGFENPKRAYSNDSDSSDSGDLSKLNYIIWKKPETIKKLERRGDTMIKYTGKFINDC